MKAAVLTELGKPPIYKDFPDPVPQNDEQLILHIKAAAVKNIDRSRAAGRHYASYQRLPLVVGIDGAGVLKNGLRVYAIGLTGMMAEKALIDKNNYIVLPDDLDYVTAAALPNAVLGAAMSLLFKGKMKKGNTVLINGATGVTGQLAVQVARHYGAAKIIATGRNEVMLQKLLQFGADITVSLKQEEEAIRSQLKGILQTSPVDVIVDYLWGRPTELILDALKGSGLDTMRQKVRIVTVGEMAGPTITLPSGILRSSPVELVGSGFGSLLDDEFEEFNKEIVPEMFQLAASGKLEISTQTAKLENIESAWQQDIESGKRLVITME
jgi:NADPH:quinone reductase-like Zn-dependent oxidoreductase